MMVYWVNVPPRVSMKHLNSRAGICVKWTKALTTRVPIHHIILWDMINPHFLFISLLLGRLCAFECAHVFLNTLHNKLKIHLYWCGDSTADALLLGHNSGGRNGVRTLIQENCLSLPHKRMLVPSRTIQTPKLTQCFSSFIAPCHLTGWKIAEMPQARIPVCADDQLSRAIAREQNLAEPRMVYCIWACGIRYGPVVVKSFILSTSSRPGHQFLLWPAVRMSDMAFT